MKIRNPDYVDSVAAFVTANKAAFRAVFKTKLNATHLTADEIREALPPGLAAKLTDGMIEELARAQGLAVEE